MKLKSGLNLSMDTADNRNRVDVDRPYFETSFISQPVYIIHLLISSMAALLVCNFLPSS